MAVSKSDRSWAFHEECGLVPADPGVERRILAYNDAVMCVEHTFKKGAVGALHSHPHTQLTYVVEGAFEFTVGDETHVVVKGDSLLKTDGVPHGCVCMEAGILCDVFLPMREDFLAAAEQGE